MSHITKIEIEVTDLEALKAACRRLKLSFIENQKTYRWYGSRVGNETLPEGLTLEDLGKCDHAIKVPGASYEIGIRKDKNRHRLLWDNWKAGGLEQVIGRGAGLLKQAYGLEKTKREARRKGYSLYETKNANGSITLKVSVGGGA